MKNENKLIIYHQLYGYLILLATSLLVVYFATQLNHIYYSQGAPFFDSCSYYNAMAEVLTELKHKNIFVVLNNVHNSNVYFPWLTCALLSSFMPFQRDVGVWAQTIILLFFLLSLYYYLTSIKDVSPTLALAYTFSFLGLDSLYKHNGGLSDFRMDLHLFLLLGTSGIWYLATYSEKRIYPWILFGLFIGIACLSRATAPVYALVMFLPLILIRIKPNASGKEILLKAFSSLAIAVLVSGWFYIKNYNFLYYYYVVWNADANAHLPLFKSIEHMRLARQSIGMPVVLFALPTYILTGFRFFKSGEFRAKVLTFLESIDWKVLYLGLAPVLFLVFRGAGLNPFVSMPAAFGLTLFLLRPFKSMTSSFGVFIDSALMLLSVITVSYSCIHGIDDHLGSARCENSMKAYKDAIHVILTDAKLRDVPSITYSSAYLCTLQNSGIWNSLIFEYGFRPFNKTLIKDKMTIKSDNHFQPSVLVDWQKISGKNDSEKLETLVRLGGEQVDYLFLPDEKTIDFLETHISHNYINQKIRDLKKRLIEAKTWMPIDGPISVSNDETFVIYRNMTRK